MGNRFLPRGPHGQTTLTINHCDGVTDPQRSLSASREMINVMRFMQVITTA